jgi:hypothetical protein
MPTRCTLAERRSSQSSGGRRGPLVAPASYEHFPSSHADSVFTRRRTVRARATYRTLAADIRHSPPGLGNHILLGAASATPLLPEAGRAARTTPEPPFAPGSIRVAGDSGSAPATTNAAERPNPIERCRTIDA